MKPQNIQYQILTENILVLSLDEARRYFNPFVPNLPFLFSTSGKHKKIVRFSDVFRA